MRLAPAVKDTFTLEDGFRGIEGTLTLRLAPAATETFTLEEGF